MSTIRICTPVTGKTIGVFLDNLEKIQTISEFVELRVDTITELTLQDVATIRKSVKKETIFTCRKKADGGSFTGDEKKRTALLQRAIDQHFHYVDIELATVENSTFICNDASKIIISYHNLTETPSYWDMNKLIFQMKQHKPDVIKIATMVKEEYETTKLYRLLTNRPHEEQRIVIGLGEKARITQILGPILGSFLTVASTKYSKTTLEQLELEELKKIYSNLL